MPDLISVKLARCKLSPSGSKWCIFSKKLSFMKCVVLDILVYNAEVSFIYFYMFTETLHWADSGLKCSKMHYGPVLILALHKEPLASHTRLWGHPWLS